jgi:hypothetical protein
MRSFLPIMEPSGMISFFFFSKKKVKGKVVPVLFLTEHHAPAALPQGKSPWYTLDRRPGGPQSQSGHGGEEKKFSALARTQTPDHPACSPLLYC